MPDAPLAAPFPYFGGKRRAAPIVWRALGDPSGYVEPFCGSAAVLLARPAFTGRRVETINDADGWLVNTWRALQLSPDEVAAHAFGPVVEIDYHARLAWLQERRTPDLVSWLEGDPEAHDPKAAGWWLYVVACGIGDPFGPGPWRTVDGHLRKLPHLGDAGRGVNRALPHLGDAGRGVNRALPHLGDAGRGVNRKLPHLGNAGRGVNRELPHLGNAGQGVNRELPHLGDAGRGVNRELPHLGNAGQGVNRELPHLGDAGRGLVSYLNLIAERLTRVRITCGSWERVVKPSVTRSGAQGDGSRAIFLDPPYSTSGDLYAHVDTEVSHAVREWCLTKADPDLRIVLCGYDDEHAEMEAAGWTVMAGKAGGGAGYSVRADNGRRERLWLSPACLSMNEQGDLFGEAS